MFKICYYNNIRTFQKTLQNKAKRSQHNEKLDFLVDPGHLTPRPRNSHQTDYLELLRSDCPDEVPSHHWPGHTLRDFRPIRRSADHEHKTPQPLH